MSIAARTSTARRRVACHASAPSACHRQSTPRHTTPYGQKQNTAERIRSAPLRSLRSGFYSDLAPSFTPLRYTWAGGQTTRTSSRPCSTPFRSLRKTLARRRLHCVLSPPLRYRTATSACTVPQAQVYKRYGTCGKYSRLRPSQRHGKCIQDTSQYGLAERKADGTNSRLSHSQIGQRQKQAILASLRKATISKRKLSKIRTSTPAAGGGKSIRRPQTRRKGKERFKHSGLPGLFLVVL
jgi:hypothetical protein